MESAGQDVAQEPADEVVGRERHHLVSIAAFDPVVLPLEGDALVVERDQPTVGDGDAVGVAGQIGPAQPWARRTGACCRPPIRFCAVAPDMWQILVGRSAAHDCRRTAVVRLGVRR